MNEKLFFRLYRSSHFNQVYERDIVDCNITIQGIFILLEPGIDAFVSFGSLFECVHYAVCCVPLNNQSRFISSPQRECLL